MKGLLLCLLFVYAISATGLYEGFKNGYPANGVDIVIDDERYAEPSLETPGLQKQTIQDTQIFNILAQSFGTPLIQNNDARVPLKNANLFSRPKSHFFFVLEGFTDQMTPTTFQSLRKTEPSPIERSSRPYYPQAMMATAVTAQQPKQHGVFHQKDNLMNKNIFDLITSLYDGAVFGGSLNETSASILSPHVVGSSFHWDAVTSTWKGKVSQLTQVTPEFLHQQFPAEEAFLSRKDSSIRALVAELSFVLNAAKVLSEQYPSYFFSFHFQAPQLIVAQFGPSSESFNKAMKLIDQVITVCLRSNPSYAILYLPALNDSLTKEMKAVIAPLLMDKVKDNDFFPYVRLNADGLADKQKLCQDLRDALTSHYYSSTYVFCALTSQDKRRSVHGLLETIQEDPKNYTIDEPVWRLHTYLWLFILLIVGLFWAIYAIAFIEPDVSMEESAAYVKTAPHQKWD